MAFRGGRDDRDVYYSTGRGPRGSREEIDIYERREERRSPPPRRAPVREYEETDVRIERDRVPAFMRDAPPRRQEAGPLVLRQREVETIERPRGRLRSPSPAAVRVRERSRVVQRERSPSLTDSDRIEIRDHRVVERERDRIRSPSRGPAVERVRARVVERERSRGRGRSPSPVVERDRIRIVERERERERLPSPSPSPPPVIRGPTIEREVITHYTDVDHGMIVARPPSPPPPHRRQARERDTEIDITTSRHRTEVDIRESSHDRGRPARGRSPSHERPSPRPLRPHPHHHHDDEVIVRRDRNKLSVEIDEHHHHPPRRARSAAPPARHDELDDESDYITSRINERGRAGEAWHGHTRDWTIVDVPPGTERVRMDGVGGGAAEVTWQRYNGVRRARFLPDGVSQSATMSTALVPVAQDADRDRDRDRDRVSVQILDRDREIDVEAVTDRRIGLRPSAPPPPKRSEMWTEITKDLVVREAVQDFGYEYEETEWFFYIMQYLRYEDVLALVKRSDDIRRRRKERAREIEWEREHRDHWRHHHHHHGHHRRWHSRDEYDDERIIEREREVVFDRPPVRGYL